jgi:hypothetical protein
MQLRDKVTSTGIDQRFCTRITVTECHSPPAGVGTLRSFNAAAMARADIPASSAILIASSCSVPRTGPPDGGWLSLLALRNYPSQCTLLAM